MTTEIDPYEAIIALALADSGLTAVCSTRIDIWHRYGQGADSWSTNDPSLIFVPSGGEADRDNAWSRPLLEARCYATSPFDCGLVWKKLNDFVFNQPRRTITITDGKALINYILPVAGDGMPRLQFDEDIKPNGGLPFYAVQLVAEVSNLAVT